MLTYLLLGEGSRNCDPVKLTEVERSKGVHATGGCMGAWVHGPQSSDPEHCQEPKALWGCLPSGFPGPRDIHWSCLEHSLLFVGQVPSTLALLLINSLCFFECSASLELQHASAFDLLCWMTFPFQLPLLPIPGSCCYPGEIPER